MQETTGVEVTLRGVRDQLEQMHTQLEALSEAIWRSIDHEDAGKLEEGVRFKQRYNDKREPLEDAMGQMLALLRDYPESGPGTSAEKPAQAPLQEAPEERPEAAVSVPPAQIAASPLAGSLEHKVPFGFVLGAQTYTSASAWPLFYEALLQELYGRAPEKLSHLADAPGGFEYAGRPLFARVPDSLEDPLPIADAIFAEADLAPGILLEVIKRLIGEMGYPLDSFKILLKEQKRGTVETLSIAA